MLQCTALFLAEVPQCAGGKWRAQVCHLRTVGGVRRDGIGVLLYEDDGGITLNSHALELRTARVDGIPEVPTRRRLTLISVGLPNLEARGGAERPGCSHFQDRFPAERPLE